MYAAGNDDRDTSDALELLGTVLDSGVKNADVAFLRCISKAHQTKNNGIDIIVFRIQSSKELHQRDMYKGSL